MHDSTMMLAVMLRSSIFVMEARKYAEIEVSEQWLCGRCAKKDRVRILFLPAFMRDWRRESELSLTSS
jgi:hypothetical protein